MSKTFWENPFGLPIITTLLLGSNILSALYNINIISDCDEVMNYWEPTHFLAYGKGLQTWEYSPEYGIRSYAYIWLVLTWVNLFSFFSAHKIIIFYAVRFVLASFNTYCQVVFVSALSHRYLPIVVNLTTVFLAVSPGIFISSTVFLPSTFSMYFVMIGFSKWVKREYENAVFPICFGTLFGWPFSLLASLPLGLDCFIRSPLKVLAAAVLSLFSVTFSIVGVDYIYYHKLTLTPLNIILYNIFSDKGPELYGVEPWTYYANNLFLNFNFIFLLAAVSLPIIILQSFTTSQATRDKVLHFLGLYIWVLFMGSIPHKEERFLFVVYPFICFAGAYSLVAIVDIFTSFLTTTTPRYHSVRGVLWSVSFIVICSLSVSRIVSLNVNYSAPLHNFQFLYENERSPLETVHLCAGKEWYRFPSHFFLPSNFELAFVKSHFGGQLPQHFSRTPNATWIIPPNMNDENREEPSRYIDISNCHYFVDFEIPEEEDSHLSLSKNWEVVVQAPFLDASRSSSLFRAFWVPFLSAQKTTFGNYVILRNKSLI